MVFALKDGACALSSQHKQVFITNSSISIDCAQNANVVSPHIYCAFNLATRIRVSLLLIYQSAIVAFRNRIHQPRRFGLWTLTIRAWRKFWSGWTM